MTETAKRVLATSAENPEQPVPTAARRGWLVWALVLGLAAALRLYTIGREPLWLDEGYSWWDARQSIVDLWRLVPLCDPQPLLYPTLLKVWMLLAGDSVVSLRLLSALAGIAATAVVMLAGRELNRRTAWIAGLLFGSRLSRSSSPSRHASTRCSRSATR